MKTAPSNLPPHWTEHFTLARTAALAALFLAMLHPDVVVGTGAFFYRDYALFTAPVAQFVRESFLRGEIPLWNPLNHCGVPLLAQWNTAVLYPPSAVCALLPQPWALGFFQLGHLVLAAAAMAALMQRWTHNRFAAAVAGLAFALNGLAFSFLIWTSNLAALAWMPLVVLCGERAWLHGGKSIVIAALVGAMQMLAGSPEIILFTWLLLGSLWLGEMFNAARPKKLLFTRFAVFSTAVFGLAAAQLLPFLQLLANAHRDSAQTGFWALPAWGAANFLVPLFRCTPSRLGVFSSDAQQWIPSCYPGIAVVALAALAVWKVRSPRSRWLAAVAVVGVLLAMGDNFPLFPTIRRALPFLAFARYPVKFVTLTIFALPPLAAFATDWIVRAPEKNSSARSSIVCVTATILFAALAILSSAPRDEFWPLVCQNALARATFLIAVATGFFFIAKNADARRAVWLAAAVLFLLGFDAITHAPPQNPTIPASAYGEQTLAIPAPRFGGSRAMQSPPMLAFWHNLATPTALGDFIGHRRALAGDMNLFDNVASLNGFFSLDLRDTGDVLSLIYPSTNPPAALLDYLGASQISDAEILFQWNARKTFLPLITAGQMRVFADKSETLRGLAAAGFNPREKLFLPPEARGVVTASNAEAFVSAATFSAQEITATIEADRAALVSVAQSFYPCWRAEVDGRQVKLWRANHAFQAFEIPAGRHQVRLRYEDWMFRAGAAVSLLTLAGLALFWRRVSARIPS